MLIQFRMKNFGTFKNEAVLSFVASNYDNDTRIEENIVHSEKFGLNILKSAVVFGANASGKSRLMNGMHFMKNFSIHSSKESQIGDSIPVDPFRLNPNTENAPSEFEIIFIVKGLQYRYGFETNREEITAEWLYRKEKRKEVEIFYRDRQNIDTHTSKFKKGAFAVREDMVRENVLLLSLAAQLNDEIAIEVVEWFRQLKTISGHLEEGFKPFTLHRTQSPKDKLKILNLLQAADLGIQDIALELLDVEKLSSDFPKEFRDKILKEAKDENVSLISDVLTSHAKYNDEGEIVGNVYFSLEDDESSGTQKFFALTGPILDVLEHGYILIVDELDSKLHPNLVCKIVSLFNSQEHNPNNAQLIFNTQNTNLLSSGLFRRDQIWFTDKNKKGEAELFSLAAFKAVRKKEAFEDNYIRGKYGAIPFLDFDSLKLDS